MRRLRICLLLAIGPLALRIAGAQSPASSPLQVHYNFGDNPSWANPGFNDSNWIPAPNGAWPLPPLHSDGILWVRFRVPIPAQAATGLALRLVRPSSMEASEQVFLNGTLIGRSGNLPPAAQAVVLQDSIFAVTETVPDREPFATVALRLWYPPSLRYSGGRDQLVSDLASAAMLNEQRRADRLALALGWIPVLSLNALLALVGVGLLGLWFWSRRRELLWFSLLLVLYPVQQAMFAVPAFTSHPLTTNVWTGLIALGDVTTMFVTVEFLWIIFDLRNRWLRILLHSSWLVFNAALLATFLATSGSHIAWTIPIELVALSAFNLGTLVVDIRFLVTGPNRTIAVGMAVIPIASWLGPRLHQRGQTDLFGIPKFGLFDAGFLFTGAVLSIMLVRRALSASRDGAHLRMEFAAAREIQQRLVPVDLPSIQGCQIAAAYLPAAEVGGDFYQVHPQPDGSCFIIVGDVSGKGLRAAMTGTLVLGALRTLAQENLSPSQILCRLNNQLATASDGGFVTSVGARITPDGTLTLANAGHLAPYRNGEELTLDNGLPLGIVPDASYTEFTLKLAPGDRLTFLSDGVAEAKSPSTGELFGFDRTQGISMQSAEDIARAAQNFGQEDDITVLTLNFVPSEVMP